MTDAGLVIIGGSDAGIMAGLWARHTDPSLSVTLVVRDSYPNFSICGIPFYVSGRRSGRCSPTAASPTSRPPACA